MKIKQKDSKGLRGAYKLGAQFAAALIAVGILFSFTDLNTQLSVPFFKNFIHMFHKIIRH